MPPRHIAAVTLLKRRYGGKPCRRIHHAGCCPGAKSRRRHGRQVPAPEAPHIPRARARLAIRCASRCLAPWPARSSFALRDGAGRWHAAAALRGATACPALPLPAGAEEARESSAMPYTRRYVRATAEAHVHPRGTAAAALRQRRAGEIALARRETKARAQRWAKCQWRSRGAAPARWLYFIRYARAARRQPARYSGSDRWRKP